MDESDHLTLVNAGDEEVVSQEEGGREGSAAGGVGPWNPGEHLPYWD